ncbi:MAC/perforin domain-containing protein [Spongiivirga citrea]|uniref:MACPF domain-containing protein n=1 Tax=Spongiivirga citrea TaxID=1481457 RepID=A0A6M0CRU9_9FLAO|nr:MAC/perforin domain-containing protein [Spongiivirga citrea]NER18589.1 hypothetical protein [Spongiivirga citrea]
MPLGTLVRIIVIILVLSLSSCTDKDRFILIQNPLPDTEISILKESIDNDKPFKTILNAGDSIHIYDFEQGDKLYFKPVGQQDYEILPYVADSTEQQKIPLQLSKKTVGELSNRYKILQQYDKMLYGLNVLKADPIYQNGGLTKKIFQPLASTSRNWQLLEKQFLLEDYIKLSTNFNSENGGFHVLANSDKKLQQLIRGHYLINQPFDTIIGTQNNTITIFNNDSIPQPKLYSWFELNKEVLTLALDTSKIQINSEFKKAISDLPIVTVIPDSLDYANLPKELLPYQLFINEWGTHFVERINYGPTNLLLAAINSQETLQIASEETKLKEKLNPAIKKDTTTLHSISDSIVLAAKKIAIDKKLSSQSVDDPNLHPIRQQLTPIYTLLDEAFIPLLEGRNAKQRLLKHLSESIPVNKDYPEELMVYGFKLNCFGLFVNASRDTANPKNTVSEANIVMDIQKPEGLSDSIWQRAIRYYPEKTAVWNLEKSDSPTKLPFKQDWNRNFDTRELSVYINLNEIPLAFREDVNFYFKGEFTEQDGSGGRYDDTIFGETTVPLTEMITRKGGAVSLWCYDAKKERELSDLDINISFDVEVLPLY